MSKSIKVIVAGSRSIQDYPLVKAKLDHLFQNIPASTEIIIVSGTCSGPDLLGERYAQENRLQIKRYPAQWNVYGKSAGPRRNAVMAQNATHAVIFWDSISRGTKSMINLAHTYKLNVRVIEVN